jgi:hypothetical protein
MDDSNILKFKPKPAPDPRLARLAKLRQISTDKSQMFEVRVMAATMAGRLEQRMRWEQAQRTLKSLMAGT